MFNPYHLVEPSPFPILVSCSLLAMATGGVMVMHGWSLGSNQLQLGFISLIFGAILWWTSVTREGTFLGFHTIQVQNGLNLGIFFFIISEILFFFSIFWALFHSALSPTVQIGCTFPPIGITTLNPMELPLLNTIILLSSGTTATWAHHALITGKREEAINGMIVTIILAMIFTLLQGYEYSLAPFTISDGIYGSIFFFSTGTHGIHIIIGTIFLIVALVRIINYHQTNLHHKNLSHALYYWHFVDVVWIFLYVFLYLWASII